MVLRFPSYALEARGFCAPCCCQCGFFTLGPTEAVWWRWMGTEAVDMGYAYMGFRGSRGASRPPCCCVGLDTVFKFFGIEMG